MRSLAEGRELFLIGGAQLYAELLPRCSDLFLTLVKREVAGDTFFPPFENAFRLEEVIFESAEMEIRRYVAELAERQIFHPRGRGGIENVDDAFVLGLRVGADDDRIFVAEFVYCVP